MASVNGLSSGLIPEAPPLPPKKKVKRKKKSSYGVCDCCGFEKVKYGGLFLSADEDDELLCDACTRFFASDSFGCGVTNFTHKQSAKRLSEIKEAGWAIILTTRRFGGAVYETVEVSFGDIFQVVRIGGGGGNPKGSSGYVKNLHSIDIRVGAETVTLFAHEVGSINFLEILEFKRDGVYEECFVNTEDQGHFAPTAEGKEMLINMFGDR